MIIRKSFYWHYDSPKDTQNSQWISQNLQENACARVSFIIKLHASGFIKKETLAQVFSCEFCEIFKNTFSYRTPQVAAFASLHKTPEIHCVFLTRRCKRVSQFSKKYCHISLYGKVWAKFFYRKKLALIYHWIIST